MVGSGYHLGKWGDDTSDIASGIKGTGPLVVFQKAMRLSVVFSPFSNAMAANQKFTHSKKKCLWEVKTLNGGGAYNSTKSTRRHAVETRAKAIQSEYQKKAVELDVKYNRFYNRFAKGERGGPATLI